MTVQQGLRAAGLRGLCGGAVHLPGDPAYDLARAPWNLQMSDHPAAVAYPAIPEEVAEVVRAAAAAGLSVAPQGTGHGAPPLEGRLADAVLLRTSAMNEVQHRRRAAGSPAWAPACCGATWPRRPGRTGWPRCTRRHRMSAWSATRSAAGSAGMPDGSGLQCNAVTAAELVLADGTFVRATADSDADLFWAIRGGGTPLGVVCALEFRLHPLETVVAGFLAWDWTAVERGPPGWVAWCADAPDEVTTSFRLLDVPDADAMPAQIRGRRLAIIDGAVLGDDAFAADVLAPLRALAPEVDTVDRVPAASLVRLHLDPEGPTPAYASSTLVSGAARRGDRRGHRGRRARGRAPGWPWPSSASSGVPCPGPPPTAGSCRRSTGRSSPSASAWSPTRRSGRSSGRTRPGSWPRWSRGRRGARTCRWSTRAATPARRSRPTSTPDCPRIRRAVDPRRPLHGAAPVAAGRHRGHLSRGSSPAQRSRQGLRGTGLPGINVDARPNQETTMTLRP